MLRIKQRAVFGILVAAMWLMSSTVTAAAAGKQRFVTIGTGGPKGVYYVVGSTICSLVNQQKKLQQKNGADTEIRCAAPTTGGSIYNLSQLCNRAFDFGVVQSDWQYHAYHGTAPNRVKPNENLRSVFSIHREPVRLVAAKGSGIQRFVDLKKKRVNIGNPGSGHRATMESLMRLHGMVNDDFKTATDWTTTEDTKRLCQGKIDAYITSTGIPNPSEAEAIETCGARILGLDSHIERKLVEDTPYYVPTTIPKNTYKTLTEDIQTFGVMATFVTRADVDEETVYKVVQAVMENLDTFRERHPAFADIDPQKMIKDGLSAPLHPGAIRYYKEKGWM